MIILQITVPDHIFHFQQRLFYCSVFSLSQMFAVAEFAIDSTVIAASLIDRWNQRQVGSLVIYKIGNGGTTTTQLFPYYVRIHKLVESILCCILHFADSYDDAWKY